MPPRFLLGHCAIGYRSPIDYQSGAALFGATRPLKLGKVIIGGYIGGGNSDRASHDSADALWKVIETFYGRIDMSQMAPIEYRLEQCQRRYR